MNHRGPIHALTTDAMRDCDPDRTRRETSNATLAIDMEKGFGLIGTDVQYPAVPPSMQDYGQTQLVCCPSIASRGATLCMSWAGMRWWVIQCCRGLLRGLGTETFSRRMDVVLLSSLRKRDAIGHIAFGIQCL
jgi:hypothetical protein